MGIVSYLETLDSKQNEILSHCEDNHSVSTGLQLKGGKWK